MTSGEHPPRADFSDASSKLNEGLKACRAVINDYRAMLAAAPLPTADTNSEVDQRLDPITDTPRQPDL